MKFSRPHLMVPFSSELAADYAGFREAMDAMARQAAYEMEQYELDRIHGPRFGPGRREYRSVMEPIWKRDRLRVELRRLGRPAGVLRRAGSFPGEDVA